MASADLRVHPELPPRLTTTQGVQIREDSVFTDDRGRERKLIRKTAEGYLEKLQEILRTVLAPDEAVLYITRCQSPVSVFEQVTLGWYIYYVSSVVVILTNRRLLHFTVGWRGRWLRMWRAVNWGDVDEAKITGWLGKMLELKYKSGKKEKYWRISRLDAGKIKLVLEAIFSAGGHESSAAQEIVSLCPQCRSALAPRVYECPKCRFAFKDEETMVRRSWLIPGGGYFYTGNWFLGLGDFLVEAYLLVLMILSALFAAGIIVDEPANPNEAPFTGGPAWITAGLLAAVLIVEKLLTVHHCRRFVRNFIPRN